MVFDRAAGVLLHPTSLPGPFGVGDLGPAAHAYIDWLADAKVSWWQVLPLHPAGDGDSPYCARSTFAGSPLLISPEALVAEGLLDAAELAGAPDFPADTVDYGRVIPFKECLLRRAFERFVDDASPEMADAFFQFRIAERPWLADYALFAALKDAHGQAGWFDWPAPFALREPTALADWRSDHTDEMQFHEFKQFLFARQWAELHRRAFQRGIRILGDLPMFVALDSAEVWAHRDLFLLDERGRPAKVSGVPPDYFSETGQLWGNPIYDWQRMEQDGFRWWVERVRRTLKLVDAVRLDHFRGFVAYWEVDAKALNAIAGHWAPGPDRKLFDALASELGSLPFVAEDLGHIDQPVLDLRDALDLHGIAVLQFAFQPTPRSTFIPYQHSRKLVVYSGTHDNNTAVGWWTEDTTEEQRNYLRRYLATDAREIHWDLVRATLGSVADLAIVPHQDLAGLGSSGRMNRPGLADGNWRFRLTPEMLDAGIRDRLRDLIWVYGRQPEKSEPR